MVVLNTQNQVVSVSRLWQKPYTNRGIFSLRGEDSKLVLCRAKDTHNLCKD